MTPSSNRSKRIFSTETERKVKGILSRAVRFKIESEKIASRYELPPTTEESHELIENLFLKFHATVKQIEREKRHDKRPTLEVRDEYDVQDLLHSLLVIFFDDIRPEEWTPSYAGTSTRMDFLLKTEQVVIEVKKTRNGFGRRKVGEELIIDKAHYKNHPDCRTLYCLVYDPEGRIANPRGFERDLSDQVGDLKTRVYVVPRI